MAQQPLSDTHTKAAELEALADAHEQRAVAISTAYPDVNDGLALRWFKEVADHFAIAAGLRARAAILKAQQGVGQ